MQSFLSGLLEIINSQIHLESLKLLLKSGQWLNDEVQNYNLLRHYNLSNTIISIVRTSA